MCAGGVKGRDLVYSNPGALCPCRYSMLYVYVRKYESGGLMW